MPQFPQVKLESSGPTSVLTEMDDPHGWLSAIDKEWRVVEKLEVGRRLPDDRMVACSPYALSKGDFVDIGVEMDISTTCTPSGRLRNHVHLSIVHVLQLLPACLVSEVCPFICSSDDPP
jgi:hypothetical protein